MYSKFQAYAVHMLEFLTSYLEWSELVKKIPSELLLQNPKRIDYLGNLMILVDWRIVGIYKGIFRNRVQWRELD
jgi:cytochrome c oxidase assembly factor CtaG